MSAQVTFDEYIQSLSKLSADADPTIETAYSVEIKSATEELASLPAIDRKSLSLWASENPRTAYVLGLSLGMSQERLKNTLKQEFNTSSIAQLSRTQSSELIARLDEKYDLVRLLNKQVAAEYSYGDILVARAGGRVRANAAAVSGRSVEDEIEAVAKSLGLPYETRTRFQGRDGRSAPCDLVIPTGSEALIAVAAKGFDSTGSKLTDSVREIEEMASVRLPRQMICAVIDGIGWLSRRADLQRIYDLWDNDSIDGLYTLTSLDRFRDDVEAQAKIRGLI